jgi:hypothetical protein
MSNVKISQLPYIGHTGYTVTDIVPFVSYINPTGTTSETKIDDLKDYILENSFFLPLSGGTVTGDTIFQSGLTANTISATTYQNLPIDPDTYVTGFSYNTNVFTINQNNGQPDLTATIDSVTGLTVNGDLTVTGNTLMNSVSATTISATTYQNLPIVSDTYWTSGTTGTASIKAINSTGLDSTGDRSVAWGNHPRARGDESPAWGAQTSATTIGSTSQGLLTLASGDYSHAEGTSTTALAIGSHAEGVGTIASGSYSHAEGDNTVAIGNNSHAEGTSTTASGKSSHAEGNITTAVADYSHAEGEGTIASGSYSHAEGKVTLAYGGHSHTEGAATIASGDYSHAEGASTTTVGQYSHAEGDTTVASGYASHAEGYSTKTGGDNGYLAILVSAGLVTLDGSYGDVSTDYPSGNYLYLNDLAYDNSYATITLIIDSTSFNGTETEILLIDTSITTTTAVVGNINLNPLNWTGDQVYGGPYSHAEGDGNVSPGYGSHTEGGDTVAAGQASHAEGISTQAIGNYSHTEGYGTISAGYSSHAEGATTTAIGDYSHAEGDRTRAIGLTSHAEGTLTTAGWRAFTVTSVVAGLITISDNVDYSSIFNSGEVLLDTRVYTYNAIAFTSPDFTIQLDDTTVNSGTYVADFSNLNSPLANFIAGTGAHATGNGTKALGDFSETGGDITLASGYGSHAEGFSTQATGDASHAEGNNTRSSGDHSHSEGYSTIASVSYSHAEGNQTTADGQYSHTEGFGSQTIGANSHAEGNSTIASGINSHAEGYGGETIGNSSHSEGYITTAIGDYSHSEGTSTQAIGNYSHSEGNLTISGWRGFTVTSVVSGLITISDNVDYTSIFNSNIVILDNTQYGYNTIAFSSPNFTIQLNDANVNTGTYVADFLNLNSPLATTTLGNGTHSAGDGTKAFGNYSHSEGTGTVSYGVSSHSEGYNSYAYGDYSHSEGYGSSTYGNQSHAEGGSTTTFGNYSHAEGYGTQSGWRAFPVSSVVAGLITISNNVDYTSQFTLGGGEVILDNNLYTYNTISYSAPNFTIQLDNVTITTGSYVADYTNLSSSWATIVLGTGSHSEGTGNISTGDNSHAEGQGTTSIGQSSHSEGFLTKSIGISSHSEGYSTTSIGSYSHSAGYNAIASGNTSFIHSTNSVVGGDRSVVLGGQNITGSTNDTVYVPYLNLNYVPTLNNSNTEILSRNSSNGDVEYTPLSAFTSLDTYVTGYTYSPTTNTFTIEQNQGQPNISASFDSVSGLTVNGDLTVTGNTLMNSVSATTISATTYQNLPASSSPQANKIYVDSINGTNSTGRGNINTPYLTVEYALSDITNTGTVTSTTANGSATLTSVSSTANIVIGQFITGTGIPYNSVVVSKTSNTIVLSQLCTASATITTTWWTIYELILNGNFVWVSNWFKQGFFINAQTSTISFSGVLLSPTSPVVPIVFKGGFLYGTSASSKFLSINGSSVVKVFLNPTTYSSSGTGYQIDCNQNGSSKFDSLYLLCDSFLANFGSIADIESGGVSTIKGNYYGLLSGIRLRFATIFFDGDLICPTSITAFSSVSSGYLFTSGRITGNLSIQSSGGVVNSTVTGTAHSLGSISTDLLQTFNGKILGTVSVQGICTFNGVVYGNITVVGGTSIFLGVSTTVATVTTSISVSNAKVVATGMASIVSGINGIGNITLTNSATLDILDNVIGPSYTTYSSVPFISVDATSTLNLYKTNFGNISSCAGTINVYGIFSHINKSADITGTLNNKSGTIQLLRSTTESATSTPTLLISGGTYQQSGGKLLCAVSDSKSGLLRKTATGGKIQLINQAYLKVANGLAPIQIISNTGTAQDVEVYSVIDNCAVGFRISNTFTDTTYGTAYSPNILVGGTMLEDTTYLL